MKRARFWCISVPVILSLILVRCSEPNIRGSQDNLPPRVQQMLSERYGAASVPDSSQFGPLEALRRLYNQFVPYYGEGDFDGDGKKDFVCLIFLQSEVRAIAGMGGNDNDYTIQELPVGFPLEVDKKTEVYLLLAQPGGHDCWDQTIVVLRHLGFSIGSVNGPEFLFSWQDDHFE